MSDQSAPREHGKGREAHQNERGDSEHGGPRPGVDGEVDEAAEHLAGAVDMVISLFGAS